MLMPMTPPDYRSRDHAVAVQDGEDPSIGLQALRDALTAMHRLSGPTGNITCDPNGDCADPKIVVWMR